MTVALVPLIYAGTVYKRGNILPKMPKAESDRLCKSGLCSKEEPEDITSLRLSELAEFEVKTYAELERITVANAAAEAEE